MFRLACLFLLLSLSPVFAAEEGKIERPGWDTVYDSKENSALQFKCSEVSAGEVRCEFSQISVSKKAKDNELGKTLEEARKLFRADPPSKDKEGTTKKMCSDFENMLAVLHGSSSNLKPDEIAALQKVSVQERQFLEKIAGLGAVFCKSPTEENYLNRIRLTHEKDTKTCLIKTSNFTQTFKWMSHDTWASSAGLDDTWCGVVTISRFNRATASKYKQWVYTTRKAVNNKNSPLCKDLDEDEHVYDSLGYGAHFVGGCDYVEMPF